MPIILKHLCSALLLIGALLVTYHYLKKNYASSVPTQLSRRSLSHQDDISTCFSFRTAVMPEELIKLGAPEENKYPFPRNQPVSFNVTFDQIHKILYGTVTPSIYDNWPNYFGKKINSAYITHLNPKIVRSIIQHVTEASKIDLNFIVEIGSFIGMSTINMAKVTLEHQLKPLILCIDTWLGDMNMWINKEVYGALSPVNGRPQVYEQFVANVIGHNFTNIILPFSTTSILGARFLHIFNFRPQVIFLDSAHEQGETLIELALFWPLLQPGGILVGDDWYWKTVRCDVKKFAYYHELNIEMLGHNVWAIKKPLSDSDKPEILPFP